MPRLRADVVEPGILRIARDYSLPHLPYTPSFLGFQGDFRGTEAAHGAYEAIMDLEERRVILDRGFDRALDSVLDAFLNEGFKLNPTGAGDLHRPGDPGHARRYVTFDASLPELNLCGVTPTPPVLLGCRVSMFELIGSCTLITVEEPAAKYQALASLVPRIAERIGHAIRRLMRVGTLNAA